MTWFLVCEEVNHLSSKLKPMTLNTAQLWFHLIVYSSQAISQLFRVQRVHFLFLAELLQTVMTIDYLFLQHHKNALVGMDLLVLLEIVWHELHIVAVFASQQWVVLQVALVFLSRLAHYLLEFANRPEHRSMIINILHIRDFHDIFALFDSFPQPHHILHQWPVVKHRKLDLVRNCEYALSEESHLASEPVVYPLLNVVRAYDRSLLINGAIEVVHHLTDIQACHLGDQLLKVRSCFLRCIFQRANYRVQHILCRLGQSSIYITEDKMQAGVARWASDVFDML